jgi:hypothetical protein
MIVGERRALSHCWMMLQSVTWRISWFSTSGKNLEKSGNVDRGQVNLQIPCGEIRDQENGFFQLSSQHQFL